MSQPNFDAGPWVTGSDVGGPLRGAKGVCGECAKTADTKELKRELHKRRTNFKCRKCAKNCCKNHLRSICPACYDAIYHENEECEEMYEKVQEIEEKYDED